MYPQENEKKVKLYTGSYNAPVVTGDGSVYLGKGQGLCLWAYHIAGWENALCGK